ncbi:hypothetical protein AB1L88_20875 [Tautonia sp. JC769]|uniref:hypothetical protein n=1 Tax=Tautonia sp. JC769 TaxID=3232135 RepID=UPI003459A125
MRSPIVATFAGLTLLLVGMLLRSRVDPLWLAIPGAAAAAAGFRSMIEVFADRHGQRQVPSWLGIAILLALGAIVPILMLVRWLDDR